MIYTLPMFHGGATSALNGIVRTKTVGFDVGEYFANMSPQLQALATGILRTAGVPEALIQSGAALGLYAQGYKFDANGPRVTLRSGLSGVPVRAPSGQIQLLADDGSLISYVDTDVASGPATAGLSDGGSPDGLGATELALIAAGVVVLALVLRRKR